MLILLQRSFDFNPVDPDCRGCAIAIDAFVSVVLVPEALGVGRLPLLNTELSLGIQSHFDASLDDFWLLNGACDLVTAER